MVVSIPLKTLNGLKTILWIDLKRNSLFMKGSMSLKISTIFLSKAFCKMHVCVYWELLINVYHVQARAHE